MHSSESSLSSKEEINIVIDNILRKDRSGIGNGINNRKHENIFNGQDCMTCPAGKNKVCLVFK